MKRPETVVEIVVQNMKAVRKEQGLSHEKVGELTGLHRTTIGQVESGKIQPTLLTCLKIAQALQIDLGAVITGAGKI